MQPIILTSLRGMAGDNALNDDMDAIVILAKAGKLPLAASLADIAFPANGRVTLTSLSARAALVKADARRRQLPDIPAEQLLPAEQAAADARFIAARRLRGLPV